MRRIILITGAALLLVASASARVQLSVYGQAKSEAAKYGVVGQLWKCTKALITRENGNPPAKWNPRERAGSGAYGLPQALPGSKMASEGADWATSPRTQMRWMIKYMKSRYGGPCQADSYQRNNDYY